VTPERMLVVNAGSSSLKLSVLGSANEILARHDIDPWHGDGATAEATAFASGPDGVDAVATRWYTAAAGSGLRP
jgi:acetate kinase